MRGSREGPLLVGSIITQASIGVAQEQTRDTKRGWEIHTPGSHWLSETKSRPFFSLVIS